jgi:hypothetical protein
MRRPAILGALTSLFLLRSAATAYAASDPPVALTGAPVPSAAVQDHDGELQGPLRPRRGGGIVRRMPTVLGTIPR